MRRRRRPHPPPNSLKRLAIVSVMGYHIDDMDDIVQLILSLLFGLIPLWLIILRARNRRQQRQQRAAEGGAARQQPDARMEAAARAAEQAAAEQAEVEAARTEEDFIRTDSIWGAQYFTPRVSAAMGIGGADVDAHAMDAARQQAESESESVEIEDEPLPSEEDAMSSEEDAFGTSDDRPSQPGFYDRKRRRAAPITLGRFSISDLKRAVIFSEILSAPRSLRSLDDE